MVAFIPVYLADLDDQMADGTAHQRSVHTPKINNLFSWLNKLMTNEK